MRWFLCLIFHSVVLQFYASGRMTASKRQKLRNMMRHRRRRKWRRVAGVKWAGSCRADKQGRCLKVTEYTRCSDHGDGGIEAIKQSATSGQCGTSDTPSLSRRRTSNVRRQVDLYTRIAFIDHSYADVPFLSPPVSILTSITATWFSQCNTRHHMTIIRLDTLSVSNRIIVMCCLV